MSVTRTTFNDRCDEINTYFEFITDIIDQKASLIFPLPWGTSPETVRTEKTILIDLAHTLKANGFMLLYNLTEATMSNAIAEIHDTISSNPTLGSDDLNEQLSSRVIRKFHSGVMDITKHCANPVSISVLRYWLDEHQKGVDSNNNPLFSGNVDAKKIREIAEEYGFSHITNSSKTKAGKRLLEVKKKRNELAHGHVAFKECGQNMTLSELIEIKTEVIHYLDEILTNIEAYISNQNFLHTPPTATTTAIVATPAST